MGFRSSYRKAARLARQHRRAAGSTAVAGVVLALLALTLPSQLGSIAVFNAGFSYGASSSLGTMQPFGWVYLVINDTGTRAGYFTFVVSGDSASGNFTITQSVAVSPGASFDFTRTFQQPFKEALNLRVSVYSGAATSTLGPVYEKSITVG